MTDLERIKQLEKETGRKLEKRKFEEIKGYDQGYALDENYNVVGLSLDHFGLTGLPKSLSRFRHLKKLKLNFNELTDVSDLEGLINLTELELGTNQLSRARGLEKLVNLNRLYLGSNQLSSLAGLEELANLIELDLRYNQLNSLSGIERLVNLTELNLGSNQLSNLSGIEGLVNLTKLNLGSNQLRSLSGIEGLTNLNRLYLYDNQLSTLSGIEELKKLTFLDLRNNKIKQFPEAIVDSGMEIDLELTSTPNGANGIFLYGNPIESPPLAIVKEGRDSMKNYFKYLRTTTKDLIGDVEEEEIDTPKIETPETEEDETDKKTAGYAPFGIVDTSVEPVIDVETIAEELAKILKNMENEKGRMVGIFGKWGRGKTFLIERIKERLPDDTTFHHVTFHAWKYQDTPASWAYLYEEIAKKYYNKPEKIFSKSSWLKYWWRLISLNIKRKGLLPIISLGAPPILFNLLFASVVCLLKSKDVVDLRAMWLGISFTVITSFVGFAKYLKKEYSSKASELFKKYSRKHSFKEFLGIQAEIQEELKTLLRKWMPKGASDKVLLVVDDIDRCSEERIIQIIDSLRVMLEEDGIYQRVVVLAAIDASVLEKVIKSKYFYLEKVEDDPAADMPNLIKEYFDKLFIIGIKLCPLTNAEKKEIFDVYTIKRKVVADPVEEKEEKPGVPKPEESKPEEPKPEEPKPEDPKPEEGENGKDKKNEKELSYAEYELLLEYVAMLEDATPRKIRIFYYRYLLARNLAEKQLGESQLKRIDGSVIPRLIINRCTEKEMFYFNRENTKEVAPGKNLVVDEEILQKLKSIIELVVAY